MAVNEPRRMSFEIRSERRAEVEVDIDRLIAAYSSERAEFDGTDEAFVEDSLNVIGIHVLLGAGSNEQIDDGVTVKLKPREDEIVAVSR